MGDSRFKLLNKDFIIAIAFVAIGLAAVLSFLIRGVSSLGIGIFCGFFPTGLGLLIMQIKTAKSSEMQKRTEIKNEERNLFIRSKAGHSAFWVVYVVVFAAWALNFFVNIRFNCFVIALIIFMPITYFSFIAVYNRRY